MQFETHRHDALADSSVYFALTKDEKTGIYFSGNDVHRPVFVYCAYRQTRADGGGYWTGYMPDIGDTDEGFTHERLRLRSAISLYDTPRSVEKLSEYRQKVKKRSDKDRERNAAYGTCAQWLTAYLGELFHIEETYAEALIKHGKDAAPGSVLPVSSLRCPGKKK